MYDMEVVRSKRKTIAIEINREGRVLVRAPINVSNMRIREFVESHADWIEKTLRKIRERGDAGRMPGSTERTPGSNGNVAGGDDGADDIISTDRLPALSAADIATLTDAAKAVIPGRVAHYAAQIGVTYGRITIRHQRSRWGSCSTKGNLNFNCLLMQAPEEILDYVIIHELCHRKQMNHSKEFWTEVEAVCPDYKKRRRWLRDHGDELMHAR